MHSIIILLLNINITHSYTHLYRNKSDNMHQYSKYSYLWMMELQVIFFIASLGFLIEIMQVKDSYFIPLLCSGCDPRFELVE